MLARRSLGGRKRLTVSRLRGDARLWRQGVVLLMRLMMLRLL